MNNQILILNERVVPMILNAMESQMTSFEVQHYACWTLANLSVENDSQVLIANEGLVPVIRTD